MLQYGLSNVRYMQVNRKWPWSHIVLEEDRIGLEEDVKDKNEIVYSLWVWLC